MGSWVCSVVVETALDCITRLARMSCTDGKKRYNARAFTLEATNTENPMKKMTRIAALITFAGLLCACNTVQGFGQDVEKAGQKVSNAAERAK